MITTQVEGLYAVIPTVHGQSRVRKLLLEITKSNIVPEGIVVVDNHPGAKNCRFEIQGFENVTLIQHNDFLGTAHAFFIGIVEAVRQGSSTVWLLDDDTLLWEDSLQEMVAVLRRASSNKIIIAPNTNNSNAGLAILGKGLLPFRLPNLPIESPELVPWSGMLISDPRKALPFFEELGHIYWWSWDDYALCKRLLDLADYQIATVPTARLGQPKSKDPVRWKEYYSVRNGVLFGIYELTGYSRWRFLCSFIITTVILRKYRRGWLSWRLRAVLDAFYGKIGKQILPKY